MIKKIILSASALLILSGAFANAQTTSLYGFVRSYYVHDSHASTAGTEDLYYYMPKDNDAKGTSNFTSLTSRVGLDVKGYEFEGYKMAAKIEADFYSKSGTTAILRLRQAYATVAKDGRSWKIGQAWHPMAADMPDIFSLETAAPFGPFNRSPLVSFDKTLESGNALSAALIWQMQYTSAGPDGAVADYIKRSGIPELYLGYTYRKDAQNFLRIGADVLTIKPFADGNYRVSPAVFFYGQSKIKDFVIKEKITYAYDGSHMNMIGGYGITGIDNDGKYNFSSTRTLSAWATASYKKSSKWVPSLLIGIAKGFGMDSELDDLGGAANCWGKNNFSTVSALYRIQPEIVYNLGKFQFGTEYMLTSAQYGKAGADLKVTEDLHWVSNHRFQMIFKFTF